MRDLPKRVLVRALYADGTTSAERRSTLTFRNHQPWVELQLDRAGVVTAVQAKLPEPTSWVTLTLGAVPCGAGDTVRMALELQV